MIIGLGLDLVEFPRIEAAWRRFGHKFAERVLHPEELRELPQLHARTVEYLAARFAAKEAAVKALGTGFSGGISLQTVYVRKLPSGRPEMAFVGPALKRLRELGADESFLSLTHGKTAAAAVLILTRRQP